MENKSSQVAPNQSSLINLVSSDRAPFFQKSISKKLRYKFKIDSLSSLDFTEIVLKDRLLIIIMRPTALLTSCYA